MQRWTVVIERLPSKEKASVTVTTPDGPGYAVDAKVQALIACFRLRGWRKCLALEAYRIEQAA